MRPPRLTLVIGLLLTGTGCRAVTTAFGGDAASARANAEAFAGALEQRFTRVVRAPKFLLARMRIGRHALSPSKLAGDTAIWTSMRSSRNGIERDLELSGEMLNGGYSFLAASRVPTPAKTGDSRHYIGLVQLAKDTDWQWTTTVQNAVGAMAPERGRDIMRALFLSAERPSAVIRADYRSAFGRTATALGRLFSLDSILSAPQLDGSTLVTLHILSSDERLRPAFPELAGYVRRYLAPARYHFRLSDRGGADWFDAQARKSRLVVRFRTHDGELQPLAGTARRMPDTLLLNVDASAKISMFTVGASDLVGDFIHVHSGTERGWAMRFTREPKWDLPLLAEQLLRSPLRRPFEGTGVQFRIGLLREAGGETQLARALVVAVRESAIMRFLGNLGFTAMSEFAGVVEEEENRFIAEVFAALRADFHGVGG